MLSYNAGALRTYLALLRVFAVIFVGDLPPACFGFCSTVEILLLCFVIRFFGGGDASSLSGTVEASTATRRRTVDVDWGAPCVCLSNAGSSVVPASPNNSLFTQRSMRLALFDTSGVMFCCNPGKDVLEGTGLDVEVRRFPRFGKIATAESSVVRLEETQRKKVSL